MLNLVDNAENQQDYEGKEFLGTVVGRDPSGNGRVQVHIPGLMSEGDLPWIGCNRLSVFGDNGTYGFFGTPPLGAQVMVRFQDGDLNYGIYTGSAGNGVPPEFANLDTWGFKDPGGTKLVVDYEKGVWAFEHSSGQKYEIDNEGNVTVEDPGGRKVTVTKALDVKADTVTVTANKATLDSPDTDVTGNLNVGGLLTATNGFALGGGSSGTATMTGNVNHSGGEIRSNGVSVSKHRHVETDSVTEPPTVGT